MSVCYFYVFIISSCDNACIGMGYEINAWACIFIVCAYNNVYNYNNADNNNNNNKNNDNNTNNEHLILRLAHGL